MNDATGPLAGYRFVEIAGIGPTQLAGMLLSDMGAEVIRVERPQAADLGVVMPRESELLNRGRRSIAIDLKQPGGAELVLRLAAGADGLFEGFRPGVMERLGLGPEVCLVSNPRLVYGRMTGWGQDGPLALAAGHDPNYIALTGVLASIGEAGGDPVYPLNVIGDFGGGGVMLALGMLAGVLNAARSGRGQVIDAAMVDGAATLMTYFYGLMSAGLWDEQRGSNVLDGGAHFLRAYRTRDDRHVVVGALEPRFYTALLDGLGIDDEDLRTRQMDRDRWPEFRARLAAVFATRTRAEWEQVFEGSDACFAPVLTLSEATRHPHALARGAYVEIDGVIQPAPAPRFGATPSAVQGPPPKSAGCDSVAVLREAGMDGAEIDDLLAAGVVHGS
ncbi:MAG: CoA transferase [Gammaproteobacteria bacterium]|nr:CoA transferase [Gammaproteobacteria bacterium]NNL99868.1 CoA transferase [Gammaproteobacteria bacterium]